MPKSDRSIAGEEFFTDGMSVAGNDEAKRYIIAEILRGTLHHAYIISGKRGGGKRTFAYQTAAAVLCRREGEKIPCGKCASCKKALREKAIHPDIISVSRKEKTALGIDSIRALRMDAQLLPSESEYKIYIIEEADTMTEAAQNAFLLAIEEPPPHVIYLLLCQDTSALLDTLRSRTQKLSLRPLPMPLLESKLAEAGGAKARKIRDQSPHEWREALVCADGSLGAALELLSSAEMKKRRGQRERAFMLVCKMLSQSSDLYLYLSRMKYKRDEAQRLIADSEDVIRDMLTVKKSATAPMCFFADRGEAENEAGKYTMKQIIKTAEALCEASVAIAHNAAIQTALFAAACAK